MSRHASPASQPANRPFSFPSKHARTHNLPADTVSHPLARSLPTKPHKPRHPPVAPRPPVFSLSTPLFPLGRRRTDTQHRHFGSTAACLSSACLPCQNLVAISRSPTQGYTRSLSPSLAARCHLSPSCRAPPNPDPPDGLTDSPLLDIVVASLFPC